ncbi:MAG: UDP-N-acetylmuramate--L-alanine ligase [Eubacteriaceae bacterium]|nr:UDP-N-acetylmuramate--L-alanine ligase [Eubacteriaceae bacterium]
MINLTDYRNIHCIGIGGVGVSAIAEILLSRGYKVSGSDMKASDITERLAEKGIKVFIGHARENVEEADLIVYSAAIAEENPEIIRAREKNIPLASRAEILGVLMDDFKNSIAISGTHGKTTTTSMVSLILEHAKLEPTILVGGNLAEIGGNVKVGKSEFFVTEACEYRDSFLQLRPRIEVILNIDSDHLDYFKDIDHIVSSFRKFTRLVPEGGRIIAYDANPFVRQIIDDIPETVTFGYNENCDYYITDVEFDENGLPSFNLRYSGEDIGRIKLTMPGEHNILNAVAAFACCHQLGVEPAVIIDTLSSFTGTQRRFDVVGTTSKGVKIVDDYAHHPTEIRATLSAASNIPNNRLWCLFQPHTYTRTLALYDEFADSFGDADVLVMAKIYAAREKDIYKVSSQALAEEIKRKHPDKEVYYFDTLEEIADFVKANTEPKDLVITMGAGDIYKVGEMVIAE